MQWLVVQDDDGSWASYALDKIAGVEFDGRDTLYIFRDGLPPKGMRSQNVSICDQPFVGENRSRMKAV
jgi:hypothetical protein